MLSILFIDRDRDEYLRKCISRDMEIDEMSPSRLDVDTIWELDILFFELDVVFLTDASPDSMLIESSEYFFSFSFEYERELLPLELLLYFECLFESLSYLVLGFLFISFYLHEAIWCDLSGNSSWDERVASLRC